MPKVFQIYNLTSIHKNKFSILTTNFFLSCSKPFAIAAKYTPNKIIPFILILVCLNNYAQSKSIFDERYYDHWEAIDTTETLNVILDKINEVGLDNLTATELKFLDTFDY